MAKAATVRAELLQFLSEQAHDSVLTAKLDELVPAWNEWRKAHSLAAAADSEGSFRQALARLEEQRDPKTHNVKRPAFAKIERKRDGTHTIRLLTRPGRADAALERQLERESGIAAGRPVVNSTGSTRDVPAAPAAPDGRNDFGELRTPNLNLYAAWRRRITRARQVFVDAGGFSVEEIDEKLINNKLDPIAEEGIAVKERLLRVQAELQARREQAIAAGLPDPEFTIDDRPTLGAEEDKGVIRVVVRRGASAFRKNRSGFAEAEPEATAPGRRTRRTRQPAPKKEPVAV